MRRDVTPAPGDLLCERCGYLLNGLPDTGNCPECGKPVAESTTRSLRRPPAWETGHDRGVARLQITAIDVLRGPRHFFRRLTAHGDVARSQRFGRLAILPAVLFNAKAIAMHLIILQLTHNNFIPAAGMFALLPTLPFLVAAAWVGLYLLVVRLTTVESRYWGMRLPRDVVRRALQYDTVWVSVASLPVWLVTLSYLCLVIAAERYAVYLTIYLYTLSGAVVISAVFLFWVYATSMRALMYANR